MREGFLGAEFLDADCIFYVWKMEGNCLLWKVVGQGTRRLPWPTCLLPLSNWWGNRETWLVEVVENSIETAENLNPNNPNS
jgi:hypothetical protein